MANSNVQTMKFDLTTGALGYRSRSDITATEKGYLVSGSQNVLINEATDEGDKVETRAGYELKGAANTDRNKIKSEFRFKTKAGNTIMGRMDDNGDLEYYSEQSSAWETLLTGLDGDYPFRTDSVWNGTQGIRELLGVNHSSTLYSWSGAFGTYASSTASTIVINETIATEGFLASTTSGQKIRVKDSGGTWREFTVDSHTGSTFTVSGDNPTNYTFNASAIVVESLRTNSNKPASGFTNDTIRTLDNHVYIGSHSSSVVYMSKNTDYTDFTFSSPRIPGDGWQFVMDTFNVGFETNIGGSGKESMVFFGDENWIYRVEFNLLGDSTIKEIADIRPFVAAPGQTAKSQELIGKVGNSIVFVNDDNELVDLGSIEDVTEIQRTPLSDPIRPDFVAADFTNGAVRFFRNNLYVTAPVSGKMFILSFRIRRGRQISFWQPPQILPITQMTVYGSNLIGHSNAVTESYTLFTGTNDNDKPIAFKAHFAYNHQGGREKYKEFSRYFTEMYITSNASVTHKLIFEYLGSKSIQEFVYNGTDSDFIFTPNPTASLGVNALGTSPLGGTVSELDSFLKYRRFKKVVSVNHFEYQARYESDSLDGRWQLLCHGPEEKLSIVSPVNYVQ